jgi:serine/threonine-protein kinase
MRFLNLDDFLPEQVDNLNAKHGFPFSESQLRKLMTVVGGHPYLLRQAMYKVCVHELSAEKLLSSAASEDGPYSDHLLHHLFQINRSPEYRLKSAGLVKQIGTSVLPRYGIYLDYFSEHLKGVK